MFKLVQLFLWGLFTIDLMNSWGRITILIKILVSAALLAVLSTLEQYFVEGLRRAGDDIAGGVNGTAALLVTIMPFAICLLRSRQVGSFGRLLGLLYLIMGSVAVALTFSRTSYLALGVLMLVYVWEAIRGRMGRGWMFILIGIAIIAAAFIPKDLVSERIQSIGPALQGLLRTAQGIDTNRVGDSRGFHWRVGFAMFHDSPLVGMGYDNYGRLFWDVYQFRVPGNSGRYRGIRSPHSTYVDLLANGGILGLAIWFGVLIIAWLHLKTARSVLASEVTSDRFFLVQALAYALLLQCFYGWSLAVHKDKFLWMIFGLSVAVRNLLKPGGERILASTNDLNANASSPAMISAFDNPAFTEESL
jgi:O-antigen ligase